MSSAIIVVPLLLAASFAALNSVHKVEEGYVGVTWYAGALLEKTVPPGFYLVTPFLERMENMQVTMQTDSVSNIPCGTSGGVMINFGRVEVVNRLKKDHVFQTVKNYGVNYDQMWVFDKIHHELNQFCSTHTLRQVYIDEFDSLDEKLAETLQASNDKYETGIDIVTVRVTKPSIPESLRRDFEQTESERANLALAKEHQLVVEQKAHTELRRAVIDADKAKAVREIELSGEIMEKEAAAKVASIADAIHLGNAKAQADATYYAMVKEAEGNKLRLTREFLEYTMLRSVANNSKVYFGEKIPAMFSGAALGEK